MVQKDPMKTSQSDDPPARDVATVLLNEYSRVSDGFHKAIDNYYRILLIGNSVLVLIFGVLTKLDINRLILGLVPFLLLALIHVEGQVRTTISCASSYLGLLERRINDIWGQPILIYESRLTLGRTLYYSANRYSVFKYLAYLPFLAVFAGLFSASVEIVRIELCAMAQLSFFGAALRSDIAWYVYLAVLILATVTTALSWAGLFWYSLKVYPRRLEERFHETVILQNQRLANESSQPARKPRG